MKIPIPLVESMIEKVTYISSPFIKLNRHSSVDVKERNFMLNGPRMTQAGKTKAK